MVAPSISNHKLISPKVYSTETKIIMKFICMIGCYLVKLKEGLLMGVLMDMQGSMIVMVLVSADTGNQLSHQSKRKGKH